MSEEEQTARFMFGMYTKDKKPPFIRFSKRGKEFYFILDESGEVKQVPKQEALSISVEWRLKRPEPGAAPPGQPQYIKNMKVTENIMKAIIERAQEIGPGEARKQLKSVFGDDVDRVWLEAERQFPAYQVKTLKQHLAKIIPEPVAESFARFLEREYTTPLKSFDVAASILEIKKSLGLPPGKLLQPDRDIGLEELDRELRALEPISPKRTLSLKSQLQRMKKRRGVLLHIESGSPIELNVMRERRMVKVTLVTKKLKPCTPVIRDFLHRRLIKAP